MERIHKFKYFDEELRKYATIGTWTIQFKEDEHRSSRSILGDILNAMKNVEELTGHWASGGIRIYSENEVRGWCCFLRTPEIREVETRACLLLHLSESWQIFSDTLSFEYSHKEGKLDVRAVIPSSVCLYPISELIMSQLQPHVCLADRL